MVTKCANPSCSASFQYFRNGKLFLIELPRASSGVGHVNSWAKNKGIEYFWLCDRCSSELTVTVDRSGRAAVAKVSASSSA